MTGSAKKIFQKGDVLIREGEPGDRAYVIESGNVEILIQRDSALIQIGTRGAGSIIGEMAMIDDRPRTATVRAVDECRVMEISREDFARRVDSADPILKMVMRVIMTRYRDMISRSQFVQLPGLSATAAESAENDDELHKLAVSTIKIHHELKAALEKNELVLYYQPIIDLQNMKIAGFEALMRWKHPEKGMISPGVFIPVAEESGLIVDLSRWALDVSCDAVKNLRKAANPKLMGPHPLFVSVNFSVKDFANGNFDTQVEKTLKEKGTDPAHIHLEITESLLMEAPGPAKEALEKCRQLGVSISIDDFGTGYSSLSYLHYFPIDTLKIDQSFIRSMSKQPSSYMLVKSIIGLAHNMNMKVIAEGIETEEEAATIRGLGCEECQGFWFAKPMPLEDALSFVQNWAPKKISFESVT
jgi:EAL domain-containing protein (putative c-di-GMP-specific phosphodiesterase class I)/CRP-like cAMP-binding protein